MSRVFVLCLMLVASVSMAGERVCSEQVVKAEMKEAVDVNTAVPSFLKGAVIIVRQPDGRESVVPASRFKVVPRKQQFVVAVVEVQKSQSCTVTEGSPAAKNRLSLVAGLGPQGRMKVAASPTLIEIEEKMGPVVGLQYQWLVSESFSVGIQGQSNQTGSLLLGLDF